MITISYEVADMVHNLKLLRTEYGLSQQELADKLEINQQSINNYENRSTEPNIELLIKLADYFQTSVDYLIGYDEVRDGRLRRVSAEELRLLENIRQLPGGAQAHIREMFAEIAHEVKPHL
jgi:transcriptional regulator with XRE-family HTH domain